MRKKIKKSDEKKLKLEKRSISLLNKTDFAVIFGGGLPITTSMIEGITNCTGDPTIDTTVLV